MTPKALLLPSLIGCASLLCWRRPERSTAVLLALCGALLSPLGVELVRPIARLVVSWVSTSAAKLCSDVLVRTTLELLRHEERTDLLLDAASEAMRKAMTNKQVQSALKETVIDALRDENLQKELVSTLTKAAILSSGDHLLRAHLLDVGKDAIVRALKDQSFTAEMVSMISKAVLAASQNSELRDATLDVVKAAVTDALKDEGFMEEMLSTLTRATIVASKDQELRDTLLGVTKEAVVDALRDEGFMNAFQKAMCQGLKDSNIYRSAAKGVVKSLNPFAGGVD